MVVTKAHQNLTFTTPPNLQRAVAAGLAKDDAYFATLSGSLAAKCARLSARGWNAIGFRVLPTQGSYFITADFTPPSASHGDDVAFCRHITEQRRRGRHSRLRVLRIRGAPQLGALCVLQAGCGAR